LDCDDDGNAECYSENRDARTKLLSGEVSQDESLKKGQRYGSPRAPLAECLLFPEFVRLSYE